MNLEQSWNMSYAISSEGIYECWTPESLSDHLTTESLGSCFKVVQSSVFLSFFGKPVHLVVWSCDGVFDRRVCSVKSLVVKDKYPFE
jgi:hypothetical protein